jgi:YD repeat-containing protein
MKKLLYAIALLGVAALAFTACNNDEEKEEPKIKKRLTMCGDQWDKYVFTYGEDGKIALVNRNEGERTWTFTWNGNVGTAKYVKEGEEKGDNVFTLGENGYLKTWANEWGDTWGFTYDSEGHLTQISRTDKGAVKSNCMWAEGDLYKWSRFKDDGSEEWKMQGFLPDENVGGIFADACDKADVSRWIFELGFCGKPSKHLLDQAAWQGSEAVAVHTYEKDADGFVTKVNKVYDGGDPEIYEYAWEVVK